VKNFGRRLLLIILLFNAAAFLGFFLYSIIQFPASEVLPVYLWQWVFSDASIRSVEAFMPVTISAVLLSFSFFFNVSHGSSSSLNFHRIAGTSILLFIFLVAIYTLLAEGFAPGFHIRLEEYKGNTRFAEGSLREADRLFLQNRLEEALIYFDYYLFIDPDNDEVVERRDRAAASLELDREEKKAAQRVALDTRRSEILNQDAAELTVRAREYLARRDYYSAHYYADMAIQLEPQRGDARRVAAEAWNKIRESEFSREASAAGDFFKRKREAYSTLNRGNTLQAYYLFMDLLEEHPLDQDIQTFSAEALERVRKEAFFIDETEHVRPIPGRHRIFFLNQSTPDLREFVYFDRFIPLGTIAYAFDIEFLGISPQGNVIYHFTAPTGKIIESDGSVIMLKSIHRSIPDLVYEPVYLEGSPGSEPTALKSVSPSIIEIPGYSMSESSLKLQYIHELLALRPGYEKRGLHPAAVEVELVMRVMRPFSLLIFGTLSIALGWALRARYGRRWYHVLLLPVIPVVVFLLSDLYLYASRLVHLYLLLQSGFILTLVTMLFVQAVLFTVSLILLAGQSTHDSA
jgi:tetratricopeptide (TPR) repeat protein